MGKAAARSVTVGLVGLLLLLAWSAAEAQLPAASAGVARITGPVSVLARGQQNWVPATVGARLVEGDQIRALTGASADLNLPDGSTILVAENTRFAVTRLQYDPRTRDRNASFYLVAGKVRAQVSQAAVQLARQRESNFTISTPSGVAAVRGTIVTIIDKPATNPPSETLVFSEPSPGQAPAAARVSWVNRAGQNVLLIGRQFTRQVGLGAPSAPQPISSLSGAAQAAIPGPANPGTAGVPDLTAVQVTISTSEQDTTLVQTAIGATVGAPAGVTTDATTTTTTSGFGQDINNNEQQPKPPSCATPPC